MKQKEKTFEDTQEYSTMTGFSIATLVTLIICLIISISLYPIWTAVLIVLCILFLIAVVQGSRKIDFLEENLPGQLAEFQDKHIGDSFFIESVSNEIGICHARHINSGKSRWYEIPVLGGGITKMRPNESLILGKDSLDRFMLS